MSTLVVIPESQLKRGASVGAGAFGKVYRGTWYKGLGVSPNFTKKVDAFFSAVDAATVKLPTQIVSEALPEDYASPEYLTTATVTTTAEYDRYPVAVELIKEPDPSVFLELVKETEKSAPVDETALDECEAEDGEDAVLVAVKELHEAADSNVCKALLEEARVSRSDFFKFTTFVVFLEGDPVSSPNSMTWRYLACRYTS